MKHIFREYDIRGIFEKDLNEQNVKLIGYFFGQKVEKEYVFVSYDARLHSEKLCEWLTSGLNKAGKKVLHGGLLPTGANYFANYTTFCDGEEISVGASIQITGSHNPPEYNGFKITRNQKPFFGEEIYALGKEIEENFSFKIEEDIRAKNVDLKSRYIQYMANQFSHLKRCEEKFVFDLGNGAAGSLFREIIDSIGIEGKLLFEEPDGNFPNHHPDPSEEENLSALKKELSDYRYGFAYDGDADRVAFLSQKYNFKGDILAICFAQTMKNPVIVSEVKATQILYDQVEEMGGTAIMYKTGHSNLKVKLKEVNADVACEVSGHIFFNDRYFGYDDAIYATFRIIEMIQDGFDFDATLESLKKVYNTDEIKIHTSEEKKFALIDSLQSLLEREKESVGIKKIITVDGVRVIFENGWGLVRASNTTPVIVTRFEADSKEALEKIQTYLTSKLSSLL